MCLPSANFSVQIYRDVVWNDIFCDVVYKVWGDSPKTLDGRSEDEQNRLVPDHRDACTGNSLYYDLDGSYAINELLEALQ